MTYPSGLDISRGLASGCRVIQCFGRNTSIGSTFTPVTRSGFYRTPQVSGATALRVKAGGNANDTANGTGARSIILTGLNSNGDLISEIIATAGASASAATSKTFIRLLDASVHSSGTYATQSAPSHSGNIVIENASGGDDWALISDGSFPRGDTEIGVYTTPRGRSGYVHHIRLSSDVEKKSNIVFFKRSGILETQSPYSAMTLVAEYPNVSGTQLLEFDPPLAFPQLTDFGFMARIDASTVDVTVSFDVVECIP
jgi:hypothetical protein